MHALAILVLENKNLIRQLEIEQEDQLSKQPNSINSISSTNSIDQTNSISPINAINSKSIKFTKSLENDDAIKKSIQLLINNQRDLINKENEINSLNKLVNELEESFNHLKSKYNELETKILRKGKVEEEIVRSDIQNVLDSVIEKVEAKITQQDFDNTINKLSEVQVSLNCIFILNYV